MEIIINECGLVDVFAKPFEEKYKKQILDISFKYYYDRYGSLFPPYFEYPSNVIEELSELFINFLEENNFLCTKKDGKLEDAPRRVCTITAIQLVFEEEKKNEQ
jgi:hypothetical protein